MFKYPSKNTKYMKIWYPYSFYINRDRVRKEATKLDQFGYNICFICKRSDIEIRKSNPKYYKTKEN